MTQFPTFMFHPEQATEGKLFTSQKQLDDAGPGWVDTPAAFAKDYVPPPPPVEGTIVLQAPGGGTTAYVPQRYPMHLYNRAGDMKEIRSAEQFEKEHLDPADWKDTPDPAAFNEPARADTHWPPLKPVAEQTGERHVSPDLAVVDFGRTDMKKDPAPEQAKASGPAIVPAPAAQHSATADLDPVETQPGDPILRTTQEDVDARPVAPARQKPVEAAVTLTEAQKKAFYAAPIDKVIKQLDETQSPAMIEALAQAERENPAQPRRSVEKAIKARAKLLGAPSVSPLDAAEAGE